MPVLTQPNSSTCGITAVAVESNFINQKSDSVNDYIQRQNVDIDSGTNVADILRWLRAEIPACSVEYHSKEDPEIALTNIFDSINANKPVVVFFGAPNPYNPPYYDFHASVVYGYDIEASEIYVSNAYGYKEVISIVDFLNRMDFSEIDKYTESQRFILSMGLIDINMYFLVI